MFQSPEKINSYFEDYLRSGITVGSQYYYLQTLGFIHALDYVGLQTPRIFNFRREFLAHSISSNSEYLDLWLSIKETSDDHTEDEK